MTTTTLMAHGPIVQVAETLGQVTSFIAAPDTTELLREASVLRAEADFRGSNHAAHAMLQRFGAAGPGLSGFREMGLTGLDVDALRARMAGVFTTGNAVLCLDGPPPPGLRLHLPEGALVPAPRARSAETEFPAAYPQRDGLTMSGVVPRTEAATLLPELISRGLRDRLRERAGGAYAPWATYEAVDVSQAVVVAGSDVSDDLVQTVVAEARLVVAHLTDRGAADVLEDLKSAVEQSLRDPYAAVMLAHRAASSHFRGDREVQSVDDVVNEMLAVSTADVREVARAFQSTLLLGADHRAVESSGFRLLRMREFATEPGGTQFRAADRADSSRLWVSDEQVAIGAGELNRRIAVEDVAGLLRYPDGCRELVSADGWRILVEPTLWRSGTAAVERIDAVVPAEQHVTMPARADEDIPPQPSGWRRFVGATGRSWLVGVPAVLLTIVVLVATAAGLHAAGMASSIGPAFLGVTVAVFLGVREQRRKSRQRET